MAHRMLRYRQEFPEVVDDVVDAYEALALKGKPGQVYNVCSGRSRAIGEALEHERSAVGQIKNALAAIGKGLRR